MHLPKINEEKNWDTIAAFIRQYPFAMLINVMDAKPLATHLPVELFEKTPGQFVLQGHVAKANPQWQAFTTGTALAIFTEPHAYVSSSWYEKEKIPTWKLYRGTCVWKYANPERRSIAFIARKNDEHF